MLRVLLGLDNYLIEYFWKSWFDKHVYKLNPQENTAKMTTMMSDFQITKIEERHKKLQSDVKEYVLGLAEVCKILSKEDFDDMMREKFLEEKVQTIETIDEQRLRQKNQQNILNRFVQRYLDK